MNQKQTKLIIRTNATHVYLYLLGRSVLKIIYLCSNIYEFQFSPKIIMPFRRNNSLSQNNYKTHFSDVTTKLNIYGTEIVISQSHIQQNDNDKRF